MLGFNVGSMMRQSCRLLSFATFLFAGLPTALAGADPFPAVMQNQPEPRSEISGQSAGSLPVIVTYELKRENKAARAKARSPKAFWIKQIVARIEASKKDPPTALKDARTVRLSFVVARDGRLVSKGVSTSSGLAALDKAAVAMLDRAQPFPPMPEAMSDGELTFDLPVRFR